MDDSPAGYARYAGATRFPRDRDDLTSTSQCPACFTTLTALVCTTCGLDLENPAAAELALVSTDVAGLLDERIRLIGRIRFESARAAREAEAAAASSHTTPDPADSADLPLPPPVGQPLAAAPPWVPAAASAPAPTPPPRSPSAPPAAPRRSSVQVALIIVGVSLVSIAAIYFLVYAFITYGIVWRSVIIGAITVAAFAVASLLRRKNLSSTAEGIGAFAVVLVYLDAFAIRANDLFDAGSSDALVYWGSTLVLSAAGFAIWHRASALRVASVAAAIAFAPGIGLLAAGIAEPLDGTSRVFAAFLAVALAGLLHPVASPRGHGPAGLTVPEHAIAASIGAVGIVVAFSAGYELARSGSQPVSPALWTVALVAVAHIVVVARGAGGSRVARVVAAFYAAAGALAVSLAMVLVAFRTLTSAQAMIGITVAPALLVLVLAFFALRSSTPLPRLALRTSAYAAAAITVSMLSIPATHLVVTAVTAVTTASGAAGFALGAGSRIADPSPDVVFSAVALVVVLALVVVFARVTATTDRLRTPLAWAGGVLALLLVPVLGSLGAVVAGWLTEAAVAVVLLVWARRTGRIARLRLPAAVLGAVALALGFALSWAGADTWAAGAGATVLVLVAARWAVPGASVPARAALLALAAVVALGAAAAAGLRLGDDRYTDPARAAAGLAVVLFGLCALRLPRLLSALDRRSVFVVATAAVASAAPFTAGSVVLALLFVVAVLGWIVPRGTGGTLFERRVAAVALAPAAFWVASSITRELPVASVVVDLAAVAAALLAAAASLALAARTGSTLRVAADIGVAAVAVPAVLLAPVLAQQVWIVLLVAAVTALLSAFSPAGLFAAPGTRRHLGWVALALATAALWWRLDETSVSLVEAYTLPLAGAVLVIAALDWRARRSATTPLLVLAGLLVAVLPSALATTTRPTAEAVLVTAVAAALLLVGSVARVPERARGYLDALAVAGFASLVVATVAQSVRSTPSDATADAWVGAALVVLAIAAFGQCSGRPGDRPFTARVGQALLLAGLTLVVGVEVTLLDDPALGFARTLVAVVLFSALHVAAQPTPRLPLDRATGWVAIGYATLVGVVALVARPGDAAEWVSVPIALSLLTAGALRLAREPGLRSAPALGGGLLVLFLPSLFETTTEGDVWRLVAVGVLAVAATVVGLMRRLQAPFVVGAVVAIVHGVATFEPQIRAVYRSTEWWVWAGAGGILIIVLGARYERSLRTAKNVVAGIGALR